MPTLQNNSEINVKDLLGKGLYSLPDAARIIHAYPQSVRRWATGYHFGPKRRFSPPVLSTNVLRVDGDPVLTFEQLIELLFINLFREKGLRLPVIRAAAHYAGQILNTDHPFAVQGLMTDGRHVFMDMLPESVTDIPRSQVVHDLNLGQTVIAEFAQPYFKRIDYDMDEARRYYPLGKGRRVVIDPQRSFGSPIDIVSGIPTNTLFRMSKAGDAIETIASWYGVEKEAVQDAIDFEAQLGYRRRQLLAA